jgi:hypothetical protein
MKGVTMNEGSRKALSWVGALTAVLLWFISGVIGGSTGVKRK